jgi:hypothetical protein
MLNFGMPRIGNPAFSTLFDQVVPNSTRVTHEADIVPHLPPEDVGE